MALCLLAVSPREGGHGISLSLIYDCRHRHSGRPHAREKNGGRDAGRSEKWNKPHAANSVANRKQSRAWGREARDQADRRVHGCVFVPVLAVGGEAVAVVKRKRSLAGLAHL